MINRARLAAGMAAGILAAALPLIGGASAQQAGPRINPPNFSTEPGDEYPVAVLGGLDKITARVSSFEAPINEEVQFGSLSIVVRSCHKRPPEEPPETTAFLEISDVKPGEKAERKFTGWMFASSPALSALEHPVYDVWVTNCKTSLAPPPAANE